jgi:hypothetical protein
MAERFKIIVLRAAVFHIPHHPTNLAGYQFRGQPTNVEMPFVLEEERSDTFKPTPRRKHLLHSNASLLLLIVLYARLNTRLGGVSSPAVPFLYLRISFGRD